MSSVGLPQNFCWTRFGTEAGETIEEILARKEDERRRNGGIFLWGVGNALGPSMRELILREARPEVLFSPILSKPRFADVSPARLAAWHGGRDLSGSPVELPSCSVVTSRFEAGSEKGSHYALVCRSETPLKLDPEGCAILPLRKLKNLLTGRKVGASQVSAVVTLSRQPVSTSSAEYRVAMRAELVYPYFMTLVDPLPWASAKSLLDR